ncbi:glycoside hydrolase family 25 protein [Corynebacterium sp. CNCTC7651]|uniref:glycoside hydrolase family 25 protein n=1 Tax=Corynebacterium sp. CNCTC7651 TaxID=2815361 RepID=UPI001F38730E|nr:glycoside hydrolase family 25 protein [Corynebacterium sp. CNCTC7651]UIZ91627.1 glycoside hydrolase family 25 protein [Corynebacterium sp. CNCTC7651]
MRLGVDLSEHQAGFTAFAGLDFAVLRTTDGTYRDHAFSHLLADALSANLPISTYHYLRAPSEGTSVKEQVDAALEVLGSTRVPMWLDVESPAGLSLDDVHSAHHHFTTAGVEVAGVYTTAAYWRRHMLLANPAQFGALWLAAWGDNPVVEVGGGEGASVLGGGDVPSISKSPWPLGMPAPLMWQFTSRGRVPGWDGEVDLNVAL